MIRSSFVLDIQCVPLATKPGIALIILTPMKILQWNLNRSTFVVWEMTRNVSVVYLIVATQSSGIGMSQWRIIGPIFFDATNTTATYMEVFNAFVNQLDDEELSVGYFQQDGVTYHTSHTNMAEILYFFSDCVISKGLWPPRSSNLMPLDYFLWGHLKGRVYQNKPRNIDTLKAKITEEIQAVTADILARTFQNVACRVQSCLDENGGHFQYMLWYCHISYTMR